MAEAIDTPLIRVPFESLKRVTRNRKYAIDDLEAVLKSLHTAAAIPLTHEEAVQRLDGIANELRGIKRKLDEITDAEHDDAHRCHARLEHLKSLGIPQRDKQIEWNRQRIDRLLVDYLLRRGYHDAAGKLATAAHIEDLTDVGVFEGARAVVQGLQQHRCTEALEWCEQHSARLRKAKSPLEFQVRVQEFIELLREEKSSEAIQYARKHLAPWGSQFGAELQQASALLAFPANTECPRYAEMYSEHHWNALIEQFRCELLKLHSLPATSLLEVHMQAGLSALKVPESFLESGNREDPLHLETFRKLSEGLPYAKHVQSKLVCSVTGKVMNEHNPPYVLPNGYVYSEAALHEMTSASNAGNLICPVTGDSFHRSNVRRAFVM